MAHARGGSQKSRGFARSAARSDYVALRTARKVRPFVSLTTYGASKFESLITYITHINWFCVPRWMGARARGAAAVPRTTG